MLKEDEGMAQTVNSTLMLANLCREVSFLFSHVIKNAIKINSYALFIDWFLLAYFVVLYRVGQNSLRVWREVRSKACG